MNIEKLNQWLMLIANFGVLLGIGFLAIEIQQNTQAIEREISISQQQVIHGQFVESDDLPRIQAQINEVQGNTAVVVELSETFNLSMEDAHIWSRYLTQIWQQNETNWKIVGDIDSICRFSATLINSGDNEIYWRHQRRRFDPGFIRCVEETSPTQLEMITAEN